MVKYKCTHCNNVKYENIPKVKKVPCSPDTEESLTKK